MSFDPYDTSSFDPTPITLGRVEAAVRAAGWKCAVDDDGGELAVTLIIDGNRFWLSIVNDDAFVHLRANWRGYLPPRRRVEALEVCNDYQCRFLVPRVMAREYADGDVCFRVEHNIHTAKGIHDDQLFREVERGIRWSLDVFEFLENEIPDAQGLEPDAE